MLERLYIRNYVIIEELTLDFGQQLNVLTGETGAGKSIIAGALSLILGDRADTSVLINKDTKCIVEAVFRIGEHSYIQQLLEKEELDAEEELIIRREISAKGKSRAFVNDTPVVLTTLNKITAQLVDLHRQFDQYLFREGNFEYEVIDAVAANQALVGQYAKVFGEYRRLEKQYKEAWTQKEAWQKEADYKRFLFEELQDADFQENELEQAEETLKQLSHAEQIKQVLAGVHFNLEEAEPALNNQLRSLGQQLASISAVFPAAAELAERLESARIELKDIAEECSTLENNQELDEAQLQILQERIDLGNRLLKKHQVSSTNDLIQIFTNLKSALSRQDNAENDLEALALEKEKVFEKVKEIADKLHQSRQKQAPLFAREINQLLHLVGMPNALIEIAVEKRNEYTEQGIDKVTFLWDANKSGNFQPVQKTASGGELSRIMLCIKTLTAEAIALPTLIFDEVDTGISGEAARQVGILLQKLSRKHQVLCITHQPQVAGRGDTHFFVYKQEENKQVKTHVKLLSREERILSIAQMIGGENPSEAAMDNAREIVTGS